MQVVSSPLHAHSFISDSFSMYIISAPGFQQKILHIDLDELQQWSSSGYVWTELKINVYILRNIDIRWSNKAALLCSVSFSISVQ